MDRLYEVINLLIVLAEREWIVEFWLKSSLMLAVVWLGYFLLTKQAVGLRSYFWRASVVILLLLPIFTMLNFGWTLRASAEQASAVQNEPVFKGAGRMDSTQLDSGMNAETVPDSLVSPSSQSEVTTVEADVRSAMPPPQPEVRSQWAFDYQYLVWLWGGRNTSACDPPITECRISLSVSC